MKYIKTEKDLLEFLKQVSNDSFLNEEVALSKDPFEEKFNNQEDRNEDLFEQEEDEEEEEEAEEEEESEEESEESEDSEEEDSEEEDSEEEDSEEDEDDDDDGMTPAAKKALGLPTYESGAEVSFEQIVTAINLVRAGNSTKDKKTKNEIKDYYERLDEEEKAILLIFLREFAKIMTGAVERDDAQDPSDPKAYFDIVSTKRKDDDSDEETTEDEDEDDSEDKTPLTKTTYDTSGPEDTSPPIRVNEEQDLREVRRIFKRLSGR